MGFLDRLRGDRVEHEDRHLETEEKIEELERRVRAVKRIVDAHHAAAEVEQRRGRRSA
jgi:hypothetical protein